MCATKRKKDNVVEEVVLVIDQQIVDEYHKYYFSLKKNKRKKKDPIEKPIPPSLNQWTNMHFQKRNTEKQNWKDFIVWLVKTEGYKNKMIERCRMTMLFFFPTKHRHDADNYTPKWILDGLTESGMLVDDDFEHLNSITLGGGGHDKENPRVEILIEVLGGDKK